MMDETTKNIGNSDYLSPIKTGTSLPFGPGNKENIMIPGTSSKSHHLTAGPLHTYKKEDGMRGHNLVAESPFTKFCGENLDSLNDISPQKIPLDRSTAAKFHQFSTPSPAAQRRQERSLTPMIKSLAKDIETKIEWIDISSQKGDAKVTFKTHGLNIDIHLRKEDNPASDQKIQHYEHQDEHEDGTDSVPLSNITLGTARFGDGDILLEASPLNERSEDLQMPREDINSPISRKMFAPNTKRKETFQTPSSAKSVKQSMADTKTVKKKASCNCKKSRCLKLYCDCFALGETCQDCNCVGCANTVDNEDERNQAIVATLDRNPLAFKPKVDNPSKETLKHHSKGCNCKKSGCQKKYCECYQAGVKCSDLCKCDGCKNCLSPHKHGNSSVKRNLSEQMGRSHSPAHRSRMDMEETVRKENMNFLQVLEKLASVASRIKEESGVDKDPDVDDQESPSFTVNHGATPIKKHRSEKTSMNFEVSPPPTKKVSKGKKKT